jgi:hypothetical protein
MACAACCALLAIAPRSDAQRSSHPAQTTSRSGLDVRAELASVLLVGTPGLVPLPFKKAGLAAISVASLPPRAAGTLEFFLTPGQLRRIGRGD